MSSLDSTPVSVRGAGHHLNLLVSSLQNTTKVSLGCLRHGCALQLFQPQILNVEGDKASFPRQCVKHQDSPRGTVPPCGPCWSSPAYPWRTGSPPSPCLQRAGDNSRKTSEENALPHTHQDVLVEKMLGPNQLSGMLPTSPLPTAVCKYQCAPQSCPRLKWAAMVLVPGQNVRILLTSVKVLPIRVVAMCLRDVWWVSSTLPTTLPLWKMNKIHPAMEMSHEIPERLWKPPAGEYQVLLVQLLERNEALEWEICGIGKIPEFYLPWELFSLIPNTLRSLSSDFSCT